MVGHLTLGTSAALQAFIELHFHSFHLGRDRLEGILVLLLALQCLIECPLLLADLKKEEILPNASYPSSLSPT